MALFEFPSLDPAFAERVASATAVLEEIIQDRSLLTQLPAEDRERRPKAAGRRSAI